MNTQIFLSKQSLFTDYWRQRKKKMEKCLNIKTTTAEKFMFPFLIKIFVYRTSRPKVFCQKGAVKNRAKFSRKYLCRSLREKNCRLEVRVFIKNRPRHIRFLWILRILLEHLIRRTPESGCFRISKKAVNN